MLIPMHTYVLPHNRGPDAEPCRLFHETSFCCASPTNAVALFALPEPPNYYACLDDAVASCHPKQVFTWTLARPTLPASSGGEGVLLPPCVVVPHKQGPDQGQRATRTVQRAADPQTGRVAPIIVAHLYHLLKFSSTSNRKLTFGLGCEKEGCLTEERADCLLLMQISTDRCLSSPAPIALQVLEGMTRRARLGDFCTFSLLQLCLSFEHKMFNSQCVLEGTLMGRPLTYKVNLKKKNLRHNHNI